LPTDNELILNDKKIDRALTRIAHEILERNLGADNLALIGIYTRGAHLARRIATIIKNLEGVDVPVGFMDISLYRDDVHSKLDQPIVQRTDILFGIVDKNLVFVDDVLFTGRTIRSALAQIVDFGRPKTIQLAVLIDRGHRELPIKADYVGANIPTAKEDRVVLNVVEKEGVDRVYIERVGQASPGKKSARKTPTKSKGKRR